MALSIIKPKNDSQRWGDIYNKALDDIVAEVNQKIDKTLNMVTKNDFDSFRSQTQFDLTNIKQRLSVIDSYIQHIEPNFSITSITVATAPLISGLKIQCKLIPTYIALSWEIKILPTFQIVGKEEMVYYEGTFNSGNIYIEAELFPERITPGTELILKVRAVSVNGTASDWVTSRFRYASIKRLTLKDMQAEALTSAEQIITVMRLINPEYTDKIVALVNNMPEEVKTLTRMTASNDDATGQNDDDVHSDVPPADSGGNKDVGH